MLYRATLHLAHTGGVTSRLPVEARRRITNSSLQQIAKLPSAPKSTIPVDLTGWSNSVAGVPWVDYARGLDAAYAELITESVQDNAAQLKASCSRLAKTVTSLNEDLWCLAVLHSGQEDSISTLQVNVVQAASNLIETICSGRLPEAPLFADSKLIFDEFESGARSATEAVEDVILAAFDVPYDVAYVNGLGKPSRVMAAWHGRFLGLQKRLYELLSPIFPTLPSSLTMAFQASFCVIGTDYPMQAIRAARTVYQLIIDAADSDPLPAAEILHGLFQRMDRSADNHSQIAHSVRRIGEIRVSGRESAIARLQLYRQIAEGQIRPWASTYLALRARRPERLPELGELVARLAADDSAMARDLHAALNRQARNAAAHEDYFYDKRRGVLVIGDDDVDLNLLEESGNLGLSVMFGAEFGWTCADAVRPEFVKLRSQSLVNVPDAYIELLARAKAESNGLAYREFSYENRALSLIIDTVPPGKTSHLLQSVVEMCMILQEVDTATVYVSTSDRPIIDVDSSPIIATAHLWVPVRRHFAVIPNATFLPLLAASRLSVEDLEVATKAIAWMALNEAQHSLESPFLYSHPGRGARHEAIAGLQLVARAVRGCTTSTRMSAAPERLHQIAEDVDATWRRLESCSDSSVAPLMARDSRKFESMKLSLPTPAVLPTFDPRPID